MILCNRLLAAAGLALFLQACGSAPPDWRCPTADILADTSALTKFRIVDVPDPATREFSVRIANPRLQCSSMEEEGVFARGAFDYTVELGPAVQGPQARAVTVRYYIAYLRADGAVQNKNARSFDVVFANDARRVSGTEIVDDIVVPVNTGLRAQDYEVVFGLQLLPAQLRYNRSQSQAPAR